MTPVIFTFLHPDGTPVVEETFSVTLRKASYSTQEVGFVVADVIELTTDADGKATIDLFPARDPYYVQLPASLQNDDDDGCCNGGLRYRIVVPDVVGPVDAKDIVVYDPLQSQAWDEETIQIILDAKIAAVNAANSASGSAVSANNSANESATSAGESADSASASAVSANASSGYATNSANSASASLASANLAQAWAVSPVDTPVIPGSFSAFHWASKAAGSAAEAANKQPLNANLTGLSAAVATVGGIPYFSATSGTMVVAASQAFGRSLLNTANIAGVLSLLGLTLPTVTGVTDSGSWNTYTSPGWVPTLLNATMTNGPTVYTPVTTYWAVHNTTITDGGVIQMAIARTEGVLASAGRIAWRNMSAAGVWGNWRFTLTDSDISTYGRTLSLSADAAAARTNLGLGTAATFAAQTSVTDATAASLMRVGAFGLGGTTINLTNVSMLDVRPTGTYFIDGGLEGPSGVTGLGRLRVDRCDATGQVMEVVFFPYWDPYTIWRNTRRGGTWNGWNYISAAGRGIAWNDTSGKLLDTWYENTGSQTKYLSVVATNVSAANVYLNVTVGGQTNHASRSDYSTAAGQTISLQCVAIPPGATYATNVINGTATLNYWSETS